VVFESSLTSRPCIKSSGDAISFFKDYWTKVVGNDQEQFVVACLDTKHRVQSVVLITMGTLDASLVHPREVFKPAIIEGSSSVLLSHNHPSGDINPSREDVQVTDRLTEAGKLIGIDVLDHIIYGDATGEAISLREVV
ncbi:MAG: JAB domain-containing protein, partial [Planctomycetota bacterium]